MANRGSRWINSDIQARQRRIDSKDPALLNFKEDSTQRIFRMEEEDVEDKVPGDSDE